jgi:putative endonuclease
MEIGGAVYMMTNQNNTTMYTGVTSDIITRVYQHKEGFYSNSFTKKYNVTKLVFFEVFHSIEEAIDREKQIKGGSRRKKVELIEKNNPDWKDLSDEIMSW